MFLLSFLLKVSKQFDHRRGTFIFTNKIFELWWTICQYIVTAYLGKLANVSIYRLLIHNTNFTNAVKFIEVHLNLFTLSHNLTHGLHCFTRKTLIQNAGLNLTRSKCFLLTRQDNLRCVYLFVKRR